MLRGRRPKWPLEHTPHEVLSAPPADGSWFWILPEGPGIGHYHETVSHAQLRSESGKEIVVVESVCGRAFELDRLIDVAEPDDPVLEAEAYGIRPRCGICLAGRTSRPNWAAQALGDARLNASWGRESYWTVIQDSRPYEEPGR